MPIDTEPGGDPPYPGDMTKLGTVSWISLVPGNFPEHWMFIHAEGVDLRELAVADDLHPLREVTARDAERHDLDFAARRFFINPTRYESFRTGRNCHTYSSIVVERGQIELAENYGNGPGTELIAAGDRLIARLLERGIPFRWSAYSSYSDSGEGSEARRGDERTFRDA